MTIWSPQANLDIMNARGRGSMSQFLNISYVEMGEDFLTATMPVSETVKQPIGILHGGASCVLAESVGSVAANFCVDLEKQYCVGLDINTNHIRSIREGTLFATAKPFHIGRSTQVWGINIVSDQKKLISANRLTMAVLDR